MTNKNYLRTVSDVKGVWLYEIAPEYFNPKSIKNIDTRKELEKVEKLVVEKTKFPQTQIPKLMTVGQMQQGWK